MSQYQNTKGCVGILLKIGVWNSYSFYIDYASKDMSNSCKGKNMNDKNNSWH